MPSVLSFAARGFDLARALVSRLRLLGLERTTPAAVRAVQEERLRRLLEHAAAHSPFYRRRFGGRTPRPADLASLEPVRKEEILGAQFDEALTVPGLTKARAREMLGSARRTPFVVATTSGSSGEPALYPFSRAEWIEGMAFQIRAATLLKPAGWTWARALWERPRTALVFTHHPIHVSTRLRQSYTLGLAPTLSLAAGSPVASQIADLAAFQPSILGGYPSALGLLAQAQLDGRLSIHPFLVVTGGETLTAPARARLRRAFGVEPHDVYGLTETLLVAVECREHCGMHIFEDAVLVEVVDKNGRVLPPGEQGEAVLLTNLFNRTLPLIRYEVGDLLTVTDEPCPCGLPFRRILSVLGRREEILKIRGRSGALVEVHPFAVESPLEEMPGVERFQIRAEEDGIRILVTTREADQAAFAARARRAVLEALAPYGLDAERVRLELTDAIASRHGPTDKQRRV